LPGDSRIQLQSLPETLGPGETGYLIGAFELPLPAEDIADARLVINAAKATARPGVEVRDFALAPIDDGLGGTATLVWDDAGSAAARAIALDADGHALGFATTTEVRYSSGETELCCFPPTIDADRIADVAVFGVIARPAG
jgi:hypothetical protein